MFVYRHCMRSFGFMFFAHLQIEEGASNTKNWISWIIDFLYSKLQNWKEQILWLHLSTCKLFVVNYAFRVGTKSSKPVYTFWYTDSIKWTIFTKVREQAWAADADAAAAIPVYVAALPLQLCCRKRIVLHLGRCVVDLWLHLGSGPFFFDFLQCVTVARVAFQLPRRLLWDASSPCGSCFSPVRALRFIS